MGNCELVLIRGLPGSGKSTMAQELAAKGYKHFEADMWFERLHRPFDGFLLRHAHRWCEEQTEAALRAGSPVVVANTFTRLWEMGNYCALAEELNKPFRIITARGSFESVHNVPPEKIAQMAARWEETPPELYAA